MIVKCTHTQWAYERRTIQQELIASKVWFCRFFSSQPFLSSSVFFSTFLLLLKYLFRIFYAAFAAIVALLFTSQKRDFFFLLFLCLPIICAGDSSISNLIAIYIIENNIQTTLKTDFVLFHIDLRYITKKQSSSR